MSDHEIRCWHGIWGPGQTSCRECESVIALAERGAFSEPCRCEACTDLVPRLNGEVARLRKIERAARSLMSREDFWRAAAMLVTLPGEIDNLADALAEGGDEAGCGGCGGTGRLFKSGRVEPCPACGGRGTK